MSDIPLCTVIEIKDEENNIIKDDEFTNEFIKTTDNKKSHKNLSKTNKVEKISSDVIIRDDAHNGYLFPAITQNEINNEIVIHISSYVIKKLYTRFGDETSTLKAIKTISGCSFIKYTNKSLSIRRSCKDPNSIIRLRIAYWCVERYTRHELSKTADFVDKVTVAIRFSTKVDMDTKSIEATIYENSVIKTENALLEDFGKITYMGDNMINIHSQSASIYVAEAKFMVLFWLSKL
jgi:hypothetical protein